MKFNQLRLGHYERLARENPGKYGKYLKSWRQRVADTTPVNMGNPRIEAATRSAQLNNNRGAGRWAANLTDESNAAEVAKALRSGQFSNVPESWISERVRDIVKRSEVNGEATLTYAEAGRILADTTNRQQAGYITRSWEGDGDINLGNGYRTDNEALGTAYSGRSPWWSSGSGSGNGGCCRSGCTASGSSAGLQCSPS